LKLDYSAIKNNLLKKLEYYKIPEIYMDWPEDLTKNLLKPDRENFKKMAIDLIKNNRRRIKPSI
jgi:hypothetical protein